MSSKDAWNKKKTSGENKQHVIFQGVKKAFFEVWIKCLLSWHRRKVRGKCNFLLVNYGNHVWVGYGWFMMLRSITIDHLWSKWSWRMLCDGLYKAHGSDPTEMTSFDMNINRSDPSTMCPIMQTKQIQLPLFLRESNISHET